MQLAIYAHPFDLDALAGHGGLARLAELGFGEVALATSYHDGRWLMPWHPHGGVRFLEDGTVHFRPQAAYGTLQPLPSSHVPPSGPSPLESLCAAAPAAGLAVRAWTVFGHNSRLGTLQPQWCVQNTLGDRYPYSLCPAWPAVAAYHAALAQDLGRHQGLAAIEFEAFGWLGHKHSSHHDKASFSPKGALDAALSLCVCDACGEWIGKHGGDVHAVRAWGRRLFDELVQQGDSLAPDLRPLHADEVQLLTPVLAARAALVADRFAAASTRLPAGLRRALQVHPEPWFTGSQCAGPQAAACAADEVVVTAYGEGPDAIDKLLQHPGMAAFASTPKRLSVWPKAPQFSRDEDLVKLAELAERHGIATLAVYHLGLLPWRTVERVARLLSR